MAKKSLSDLGFDFDESGELLLEGFEEGDEFEEDDVFADDEVDEEDEQEVEEDDDDEVEDKSSTIRRIAAIETTLQSLPQMIANSIATALGGKKQEKEEDEEEIPEELNGRQMVNILGKRMEKVVKAEVQTAVKSAQESDPAIREARLTAEFRACATKYGQKFVDRVVPVSKLMARVESSGGKISAEDAYLTLKDTLVQVPRGQQKQKTGTIQKKAVRVDADSRDTVGDAPAPRPKFDAKRIKEVSDAEMFQHSWNSSLMSHARRRR